MPDGYDDIDRQDLEKYEQLSDDEVALLAQGGMGRRWFTCWTSIKTSSAPARAATFSSARIMRTSSRKG